MKYTHIMGEAFCYLVQSESRPDEHYRVDLIEDQCGCRDWVCRHRQHNENTGQHYRCKHIKNLRELALDEIIEHVREQNLVK